MEEALSQLIEISNTIGKDSSLVVGTGGNTSVKTDDGKYMYIKASGTALKDMNGKYGWRRLKTDVVHEIFKDKSLARIEPVAREVEMIRRLQLACDDKFTDGARPSVESLMHVVLDKCVVHLHASPVLAYAGATNGKCEFLRLFEDEEFPPLWTPYADPGFSLSRKVFRSVRDYLRKYGQGPRIIILAKHGLLVADRNPRRIMQQVEKVISRCNQGLEAPAITGPQSAGRHDIDSIKRTIRDALIEVTERDIPVDHFTNKTLAQFSARNDARKLLKVPALTPDEMGFISTPVVWLDSYDRRTIISRIRAGVAKYDKPPIAFLARDIGLFLVGRAGFTSILKEIIVSSLFVRGHAQDMGGINPLNKRQRNFIDNWEGEKFRVKVAESADGACPAAEDSENT